MSITAEQLAVILAEQQKQNEKAQKLQQKQFADTLNLILGSNSNANSSESTKAELYGILQRQIADFSYDPEANCIFKAWWARYEPFITEDGKLLPDDMKVRMNE